MLVRTEIRGSGDPIQLDYRLEKTPATAAGRSTTSTCWASGWWKPTAPSSPQEINTKGIDGLIATLAARNKSAAAKADGSADACRLRADRAPPPRTLTAREARDTLRMLKQALAQERGEAPVVVDAGPLQRFDSSALAVLLEIDRLAQAWGRDFAIRSAPAKLAALAKLYGVDALLLKAEGRPGRRPPAAADQRRPAT